MTKVNKLILAFSLLLFSNGWSYQARVKDLHQIEIITSPYQALQKYLNLIDSAQSTIDLESYVFKNDRSGTEILNHLMEASEKRGVRVQLLLDYQGSRKYFGPQLLERLGRAGISLSFFNPKFLSIFPINHKKFLIIDGQTVFSGGRNISDNNFGLAGKGNRLDYTIVVKGAVAKNVAKVFLSDLSSSLSEPVLTSGRRKPIVSFAQKMTEQILGKVFSVQDISFISDTTYEKQRVYGDFLVDKLNVSNNQPVIIETELFYPGTRITKALESIAGKGLLTLIVAKSNLFQRFYRTVFLDIVGAESNLSTMKEKGALIRIYSGKMSQEVRPVFKEQQADAIWEKHSKLTLIGNNILIGSYNYEVISENKNLEMGFYIPNRRDISDYLKSVIFTREYINF